jgi:hypothetical protein
MGSLQHRTAMQLKGVAWNEWHHSAYVPIFLLLEILSTAPVVIFHEAQWIDPLSSYMLSFDGPPIPETGHRFVFLCVLCSSIQDNDRVAIFGHPEITQQVNMTPTASLIFVAFPSSGVCVGSTLVRTFLNCVATWMSRWDGWQMIGDVDDDYIENGGRWKMVSWRQICIFLEVTSNKVVWSVYNNGTWKRVAASHWIFFCTLHQFFFLMN